MLYLKYNKCSLTPSGSQITNNIMATVKCPVCKRTDERIQLVEVPLGHGTPCTYMCCECMVSFYEGETKEVCNIHWGEKPYPASEHYDYIEDKNETLAMRIKKRK